MNNNKLIMERARNYISLFPPMTAIEYIALGMIIMILIWFLISVMKKVICKK